MEPVRCRTINNVFGSLNWMLKYRARVAALTQAQVDALYASLNPVQPSSWSRTWNCVRSMYVCSACLGFIQANDGFPPRWRQAAGEDYFADLECHTLSSLITWLIIEQLNQISIASQTYIICRGPIITPPSYKLNFKNYCLSTSLLERNSTLQIRTAGPHN